MAYTLTQTQTALEIIRQGGGVAWPALAVILSHMESGGHEDLSDQLDDDAIEVVMLRDWTTHPDFVEASRFYSPAFEPARPMAFHGGQSFASYG